MEKNMRALVLLFLCCWSLAEVVNGQQQQQREGQMQQQQSCRTQHLSAQQPYETIRSEGGTIELSTRQDNDELDCAGVEFIRETVERDCLALQRFSNVPEIRYVVEGQGWLGVVFPGCPETFRRSPFEEEGECQRRRGGEGRGRGERGRGGEGEEEQRGRGREEECSRHERERAREESSQKIRRVRRGDVVAIYAGVAYWWYNDGDTPLRTVAIADASNHQNQLDKRYRPFFLAGSSATRERRERQGEGQRYGGNVLAGFDPNMLAEALGVRRQVVIDIQENNRESGLIVRVNEPLRPRPGRGAPQFFNTFVEDSEEDEREGVNPGGLHQFYCNMRLRHNADRPDDADVFVRDGGRLNTVNRFKLPALTHLNLAAERGVLRPGAMFAPSWVACHAILYATRGDARIQVVENRGRRVFDGRVQEGQFLVIPQFYAVMKRAGDQGFDWITFTTCHSPIRSSFTGRNSVLKAMPQEVVMNAYNISMREAHELRWNREHEFLILPPRGSRRESEE
uniref:Legumin n=2 Tax=Cryptomeria japonica TaxID=3369 RepID=Q39521_CRYJA|nr:legumin [Cryptomeria japonica]prf//2209280A legumin:ISOTYPE=31 [Cryptomeria japonica]